MALRLGTTPEDDAEDALSDAAYRAGELIGDHLADRVQVADLLRAACVTNGLVARLGEDAVQETLAASILAGERSAAETRAEDEEREAVARSSDPWHDPDWTLIEDRRGDLPPFPIGTLPPAWRPWLERAARGAGVMPDHVAAPLLAIVAGLIGAARRVQASRSWTQPICLWTAVVGYSGTGKTPDVVRRVLARIERSRSGSVDEARAVHDQRTAEAKAALRRWKAEVQKAVDGGKPAPPRPDDAQLPPPFVAPRFYVMDSTVERLAVLIEARPRGMLTIVDELAGLHASMSRYNRGGDREFWLEASNGGAHCIERVSRPPVSLAHLLVSITGGFQPSKLGRAFGGEEDGMAARYLYAWPAEPGYRPLTDEIEEADPDLQPALLRLIDLPAGNGPNVEPRTVPLDGPAREAFEAFRQEVERQKSAVDGREREAWAKAPAHVLRLAGTLAYMAWAMPEIVRPAAGSSMDHLREVARGAAEPTTIGATCIESAVRMWSAYWWPHARAALRQMGGSERHRDARRVLRWLRAHGRTEVSREDIRRDALAQALDAEGAERLMAELVQAGWLRQRPPERTGGRSRRRWEINPLLLAAAWGEPPMLAAATERTAETAGSARSPPAPRGWRRVLRAAARIAESAGRPAVRQLPKLSALRAVPATAQAHGLDAAPGASRNSRSTTKNEGHRRALSRTSRSFRKTSLRRENPMKPSIKDAYATIELLASTWPSCFYAPVSGRRPLKVGIGKEIAAAAEGAITPEELDAALRLYTTAKGYLRKLREGAQRVDLDGNPAGTVTAEQAARARRHIERIEQRQSAPVRAQGLAIEEATRKAKAEAEQAQREADDAKRVAAGRKPVLRLSRPVSASATA